VVGWLGGVLGGNFGGEAAWVGEGREGRGEEVGGAGGS